jgi:two-component system response regulator LytT
MGDIQMISIAVLEDEDEFAKTLMGHIHQYSIEMNIPIEVERFYDGMSFLDEYSEKYQIVFMDIAMPNMNGMETAEKLRKIDKEVCLIFVTSLAQYAIRGYEVSALDFIVKPVSYELFKIRMERAISLVHKTDYYTIKTADGIRKININNLMYIESNNIIFIFIQQRTSAECEER